MKKKTSTVSNKCKSTLLSVAGLITFLIVWCKPVMSQDRKILAIDSLLQKASEIQYQNFAESDSLYEVAAQKIFEAGIESDPNLWIRLLHERAFASLFHSKLASVRKYLTESYSTINKYSHLLNPDSDSLRAQTQVIEANYYYAIGNYSGALANLNEAERFFHQYRSQSACRTLYETLQFQASIYYLQGEFESCIDRYLASIPYYDCYRSEGTFPNYILVNRNVGQAYSRMNEQQKARKYFLSAKANLDTCPQSLRNLTIRSHGLILYNSIGEFYIQQKQLDSAKYFFEQASHFQNDNPIYASRVNGGLAKIALAQKDYATAIELFMKSLAQIIQARGEKHYLTTSLYRSISSLYQEQGDYKSSLLFIQKALNSLSSAQEIDPNDYTQNPPLSLLFMPKEMVMTLHQKATLLTSLYHRENKRDVLFAARNTNRLALQLLHTTRNEFSLEKDKVVLGEEASSVYQSGLYLESLVFKLTNDSTYLSECFELMDRSRSAVLMDHIKLVKTFSDLPPSLLNRERELKVELSVAEQQLYSAEIKKEETSSYRQQFGEIKKAYITLLNDIKVAAPNYYKLRIENKNLSLTEAQNLMAPDEALIEYFLSDTVLYTMVITPKGSKIFTARIDSLRQHVEAVRMLLTSPAKFNTPAFQDQWNHHSDYLSKSLISPWLESLTLTKRIIIVPHDVLNYLPFEMLRAKAGDLLVNSFTISYASSANLLREQKNMNATGNFFAGFNADYSNQEKLPQLTGALSEVNSIKDIFGFRSSMFSAATADDFRKEASRYKVIHLALHSLVNDEKPMFSRLVFTQTPGSENADITANELYSMELNAEIAVLSACETGLGKLQRGEGMMSLSRAFMYAGVPSTVISLWKVPDQSASLLMTKFYQHLKAGERKDEALRLAKLEFIEDHPEMSHPFFWAGFIVNGKTDPISLPYFSKRELLAMGGTLVLVILITMLIMLRRKKKAAAVPAAGMTAL